MVVILSSMYYVHYHLCIKSSVLIWHHRITNKRITQLYVYTWNNRIVIIPGGERMDTDMTTNSRRRLTIHHHHRPTCQPLFSFRCTYQHNQSSTPCHAIPRHHLFTTIDLIQSSCRHQHQTTTTTTTCHNWWWHRRWHTISLSKLTMTRMMTTTNTI